MSLFPGFAAPLQVTSERVQEYERKLLAYLTAYFKLAETFCTDVFLTDVLPYPERWRRDIEQIFADPALYDAVVVRSTGFRVQDAGLQRFVEESHELILPRDVQQVLSEPKVEFQQCLSLQRSILPEKARQVFNFGRFLEQHYDLRSCAVFELGAGKGYLAAHLALEKQLHVTAVEASIQHCGSLARRLDSISRLLKERQRALSELDRVSVTECFVTSKTDLAAVSQASIPGTQFIQRFAKKIVSDVADQQQDGQQAVFQYNIAQKRDTTQTAAARHVKGSNIQGGCAGDLQLAEGAAPAKNAALLLLGLHACGDLAQVALSVKGVKCAVIGCCYPHMTAAHFPASQFGARVYDAFKALNHSGSQNNGISIPRHFFSYACVDFDEQLSKMQTTASSFYERAVIERFRRMRGETEKICYKRKEKDVAEEVRGMGFSEAQITAELKHCEENAWLLQANIVVRQLFGQVFESFIIVDRMLQRPDFVITRALGGTSAREFCIFSAAPVGLTKTEPSQNTPDRCFPC